MNTNDTRNPVIVATASIFTSVLVVFALAVSGLLAGTAPGSAANGDTGWEMCVTDGLKSSNSSTAVPVTFIPKAELNSWTPWLDIFWIDQNGKAVFYKKVKPGENYSIKSYDGHEWMVKTKDEQCKYFTVKKGPFNWFVVN